MAAVQTLVVTQARISTEQHAVDNEAHLAPFGIRLPWPSLSCPMSNL